MFLRERCGWEVVGEAADSEELLAEIGTKHPNLLLLEWGLPGLSTLELLPRLQGINSRLIIIVLSGWPEFEQEVRAAGADAFLPLGDPPRRLLETLEGFQEETSSGCV
jgi:DNA-binding NarL/FixJ family response regulator